MRICFFVGALTQGGIGTLTINLTREFLKRGVEVDIFLLRNEGELRELVPEDARVFVADGNNFIRTMKFILYLKREKPDVSISAREKQSLGNIFATLFCRTEPIISVHTNITEQNKRLNKEALIIPLFSKLLYKIPNKFIAVSQGVKEDLNRRTGVQREKIKVIYNPVYIENSQRESSKLHDSVQNIINSGKKYIISAARFTEQKDIPTLIRAFQLVRDKLDIKLVIIGDGHQKSMIIELINELGLSDNVIMPGFVPNPEDYIKNASLYILSSKWEGFGNVIVEALGVGTPVVATDCPSGPSEILENGKYGKLVPVGNIEKMAYSIIEELNSKVDTEFLIERAKDFSVSKIADEYLNLIYQ